MYLFFSWESDGGPDKGPLMPQWLSQERLCDVTANILSHLTSPWKVETFKDYIDRSILTRQSIPLYVDCLSIVTVQLKVVVFKGNKMNAHCFVDHKIVNNQLGLNMHKTYYSCSEWIHKSDNTDQCLARDLTPVHKHVANHLLMLLVATHLFRLLHIP